MDYVEEAEEPIDFKYYFFLFKKNFYLVLTFFIIVVTLAVIYVSKMPDKYQAVAQLIIERPKTALGTEKETSSNDIDIQGWTEDYYNTQKEIISSPTVLRQVMAELPLAGYFENDNEESLMTGLRGMLVVERVRNSRLFNIRVTAVDPQWAANIANALARAYIRKNFEDFLYYSKEILAWLPQADGTDQDWVTLQDPFGGAKQVSRRELIENLPTIQTDETIRELREKKSALEAELQSLLRQYRERHPIIIKARANLKFLQESIEAEKKRIIEGLRSKAEGTLQVSHARMIEEAGVPKSPIGPHRPKIILMVALAELFLSFLFIFLADHFDDTIHSLEDMERKRVMLPLLGPLPLLKGRNLAPEKKALVAYYDKKSEVSESFRYIRVAINFSASPESLKNLMITSCLPHEGKSFMAQNLAISLASDGNQTLLIEADLRRPVVYRNFRVENATGLTNYLTSSLEFEAVLKESFVPNLTLVTSGPVSPNPAEILGSERMKQFLAEARRRYDRVIIDCPPLTGLGDSYVVGGLIGHIILVIACGKTPADLIQRTYGQLDKMGIKIIGVVLNQVDIDKERFGGYSKHYYHTYHRYYNHKESA